MFAREKHPRRRWLLSGAVAVMLAATVAGVVRHDDFDSDAKVSRQSSLSGHSAGASSPQGAAPASASGPCGAASAAAIASVDATVARRIYGGELRGSEVSTDISRIAGDRELVSALASSDGARVASEVRKLVYTPHWHIVRLRVLENGHAVADVGGPYIIAPVSGVLRWNGSKVGSFVMSVQDDAGYVKLVTRFTGTPIDLYREGALVMGTLQSAPSSVSTGQSVTVAGRTYRALVLKALAFPSGTLQARLFVPKPTSAQARRSCAALKIAAWGDVVRHIARRYSPLSAHYDDLAGTLKGASAGLVYVRAGSKRLVGGASPARIPHSGTLEYRGRSWLVFSWEPVPPARIYFLVAPS
jgi:hypothetical protein